MDMFLAGPTSPLRFVATVHAQRYRMLESVEAHKRSVPKAALKKEGLRSVFAL